MTKSLEVEPSAAVGILISSIVICTIPAATGFSRGLKNRITVNGLSPLQESVKNRPFRFLLIIGLTSLLSISMGAWSMYKLKLGLTGEALTLLGGACFVSVPITMFFLIKLRKLRESSSPKETLSAGKKLLWLVFTLVLHANTSLSIFLYGLYVALQLKSTLSGFLYILLGLSGFVVLRLRAKEVEKRLGIRS